MTLLIAENLLCKINSYRDTFFITRLYNNLARYYKNKIFNIKGIAKK